ncbi:MAG: tetratricopeptide repeat protein [Steroidobacteraceae bacterium]|jgi:cytochrome c-type biogenesis protein CcmH
MTTFIFIAAAMAAIAATAVAFPLLRKRRSRLAGALAGVLVMAAAGGLYPLWSNWNWHAAIATKPAVSTQVLEMVAKLERHMKEAPDDLTGWILLGRSYLALERADDAIEAYGHAHRLDPNNVEVLLGLGEAMSVRAGGNVTPAAGELFEHALTLAPDNPKALLYSGFGAATRGDRAAARQRWIKLKGMHPPPEIDAMLNERIAELGTADLEQGAGPAVIAGAPGSAATAAAPGAGPAGAAVALATVHIQIAPALKSHLTGDVPLFVFAREQGGQGPPLAAKRLTSAALGSEVRLSSADSLIPGRSLVAGQKVSITARISFSGQPLPAAGDLYGELTYDVGRDGVRELIIDRISQ